MADDNERVLADLDALMAEARDSRSPDEAMRRVDQFLRGYHDGTAQTQDGDIRSQILRHLRGQDGEGGDVQYPSLMKCFDGNVEAVADQAVDYMFQIARRRPDGSSPGWHKALAILNRLCFPIVALGSRWVRENWD